MNIALTAYGIVQITLTTEEAAAVRDDLGGIPATKVSTPGDKLHSLLEAVTGAKETPAKSYEELKAECLAAEADADIAAHPSRL
ncbi:hypothetical protein [Streptomyces sp. NPDC058872]|uniref:hypothetical protein n=1 Tax=Streptomyces sp. NPDC058872 TaxID=3346661 RepID=UPI003681A32A